MPTDDNDSSEPYVERPWIVLVSAVILAATCLASHPFSSALNLDIKVLFLPTIVALILVALYLPQEREDRWPQFAPSGLILFGFVGTLASGSMSQLLMGVAGAAMLVAALLIQPSFTSREGLRVLIPLNVVILIGAWIGFVYERGGGGATAVLTNTESGKELVLYLTTFTNSVTADAMRPSGVFDEPGALAMFSIIVVCLNELGQGQQSRSAQILLLSVISLSLISVLALFLYLWIIHGREAGLVRKVLGAMLVVGVVAVAYLQYTDLADTQFVGRVAFEDGGFVGDNRTPQVEEFFELVDWDIVLVGANVLGGVVSKDQSSHPFSILYGYGVFVWIPYVLVLLWLLLAPFDGSARLTFVRWMFVLLLLQRPYLYSMYWGLWVFIVLAAIYRSRSICEGSPVA